VWPLSIPSLPAPLPPREASTVLAPEGLVYRYGNGTWFIASDGTPNLITPHPYAHLSPSRHAVLYRDEDWNFWDIAWTDRQTDVITRTLDQPSSCPRWAQDSRHVYYSKPCAGLEPGDYCEHDIWVVDTQSGERHNLTNTPDRDEGCVIDWPAHPDTLLFYSSTPTETLTYGGAGWIGHSTSMEADGTRYSVISEESLLSLPSLSSDSMTIAYTSIHARLGYQLHLYSRESGSQLVDWGRYGLEGWEVFVDSVSWSPEGNRLACWAWGESRDSRFGGTLVLDLETKTSRILQSLAHPVYWDGFPPAPIWSPDGQWLVFWGTDENHSNPGIWVVRADGQQVYVLSGFNNDYWDPGIIWSPDGQWMAFAHHESDPKTGVWLARVGTWELFQTTLPVGPILTDWTGGLP
jgi:Tol biopolymer transport system component